MDVVLRCCRCKMEMPWIAFVDSTGVSPWAQCNACRRSSDDSALPDVQTFDAPSLAAFSDSTVLELAEHTGAVFFAIPHVCNNGNRDEVTACVLASLSDHFGLGFSVNVKTKENKRHGGMSIATFRCSQRKDRQIKSHERHVEKYKDANSKLRRNREGYNAFDCKGTLAISCVDKCVFVRIYHLVHHAGRENATEKMPSECLDYITTFAATMSPSQIRMNLMRERGMTTLPTISQISYLWRKTIHEHFKSDKDPFISAVQYLKKSSTISSSVLEIEGVRSVQNVVLVLTNLLQAMSEAKFKFDMARSAECVMDSTHKTNSSNFELYVLLVPFRGQGFPVSYLFLKENDTHEVKIAYLHSWLAKLRDEYGLNPSFVHMDKDQAQISATNIVWPKAKLSLCLWHLDRAIRARFQQGKTFPDIRRFKPCETLQRLQGFSQEFPQIWVYNSNSEDAMFCKRSLLEPLLSLMKTHYKAHPFMMTSGVGISPEDEAQLLYIQALEEIYHFCKDSGESYLFVYLYNNWYSRSEFKRWARSECPTAMATLRTSMMAEAHFNTLKYHFLKEFHRPRFDLLCFIVVTNIQEWFCDKFNRATNARISYALPSWESRMNAQWKLFAAKAAQGDLNCVYETSMVLWTCTCPSYAYGEFLLCKHLVHSYMAKFSNTMTPPRYKVRQLTPPMWVFPNTKEDMLRLEATKHEPVQLGSPREDVQEIAINVERIRSRDESHQLESTTNVDNILEMSAWLSQHAKDVSHAPLQLAKVSKLLQPLQAYRKSILKIDNKRKRQPTNQAPATTVMYEASQ